MKMEILAAIGTGRLTYLPKHCWYSFLLDADSTSRS